MAQKRMEEDEEMRRELNDLKRLNQSYQASCEAKFREVILWNSLLSDVLDLVLGVV